MSIASFRSHRLVISIAIKIKMTALCRRNSTSYTKGIINIIKIIAVMRSHRMRRTRY